MEQRIYLTAFLMLITVTVFAQPMLPGAPSQAPLDGGLFVAAAGGMLAWKKLRGKKVT